MNAKVFFTLFAAIVVLLAASCSAEPGQSTEEGLPNPASVFCEENGGQLEFRQDDTGGTYGVCIFPDGSECEEWAYFRGGCAPGDSLEPSAPSSGLEQARVALETFFSLLHDQRYTEAADYYGGTYDLLREWNPTVDPDDYATLWRNGCTMNGFQCLKIGTVVEQTEVSETLFLFVVEFVNEDGTQFVRGPCCGASASVDPPESRFEYTVLLVEGNYLVQEMPVYVP